MDDESRASVDDLLDRNPSFAFSPAKVATPLHPGPFSLDSNRRDVGAVGHTESNLKNQEYLSRGLLVTYDPLSTRKLSHNI